MRRVLTLHMENQAGALSRVAGLFSARAFNIESLTVAPTESRGVSRMTLVTRGSEHLVEQILKQINKLIDVIKVVDLTESPHVERELMLVKLRAGGENRPEVRSLVDIFRGKIVDVTPSSYVIELTGTADKLEAFLEALDARHILELARTGSCGMARGEKAA